MVQPDIYTWDNLHLAPNTPGIYAWYHKIDVEEKNLNQEFEEIQKSETRKEREDKIRAVIEKYLFSRYKHDDYTVEIRGKLVPEFTGKIRQKLEVKDSLIEKLAGEEKCSNLKDIFTIISCGVPAFSNPLYIGVSEKLRTRLTQHKQRIEFYRDNQIDESSDEENDGVIEKVFAGRIIKRNFQESDLEVHVLEQNNLRLGKDFPFSEVENLLNRINYPLLGRN